jgi:hypothetical protein
MCNRAGGGCHGDGLCESSRIEVGIEGRFNLDGVYGTPSTWFDFQHLDDGVLMSCNAYGSGARFFDRTGTSTELRNRSMRCIEIVRHDLLPASVETH